MSTRELDEKVALVTGASKGIGLAIAEALAAEGCNCLLVARSADALAAAAESASSQGVRVHPHAADLSTLEGCRSAAAACRQQFGGVDILVNCAGDTKGGRFPDQSDEDWVSGFDLKFFGAVRLARHLWPDLAARRGTVVNIGGAAAYTPGAKFMIGGAVNAALAHFTKSLSRQGLVDNVNVNIVHPGMTVSDRMERLLKQQADAEGTSVEAVRAKSVESAGIRRLGEPEDIANAVVFLCLPRSRHINGVGLTVDGGSTTGFH